MDKYNCANCNKQFQRYPSTVRNPSRIYCSRKCRYEHLKILLKGKANPNWKNGNWEKDKPLKNKAWSITQKQLEITVASSVSIIEVATKLQISRASASKKIKDLDLDVSHFSKGKHRKSGPEILIENSTTSNQTVRRVLLENNIIPYVCAKCDQLPRWNNKPLTLQLDHINGINNDHRKENLRFLCPNCHTQTPTFTGRNRNVKAIRRKGCQ